MENENQQVQSQPEQKKKWHIKRWWIVVFVIIILWVIIGTSLESVKEKAQEEEKQEQAITTNQSIQNQEAKTEATAESSEEENIGPEEKAENSESAQSVPEKNTDNQLASPAEPSSEEEQIKQLVARQLDGTNNMDKAYIREVEVVEQIDGGWGVFVEYNADDNLTANMRRTSIELDMSEIYTALYTSGKDIQTASVSAYFPLVDKYGNTSDGVVYKTMLEKTEADKVNWETDESYLGLSILPNVWETTWTHPEFQK